MKKKRRNSVSPFLVVLLIVSLVVLILNIVAVYVVYGDTDDYFADENPTESTTQTQSATDPTNETILTNDVQTLPDDMFSVVFYGPDNRVLFVTEVESGKSATPPMNPAMPQGYVFSHWDRDFSCVTEDLSVYAICQDITGQENVLALNGGDVRTGGEIIIPLQLCGNVNLCAFDIRIDYDRTVLELVEFRNMDGAVDANCVESTGEVCLNYVSMENTQGEVYLAELVFRAVGEQGETTVGVKVLELIAYDADYNFYEPAYTTLSGKITIVEP